MTDFTRLTACGECCDRCAKKTGRKLSRLIYEKLIQEDRPDGTV